MNGSPNPLTRFGFHLEPGTLIEIDGRAYCLEDGYCVREGEHGLYCVFRVDSERLLVGAGKNPNIYLGQEVVLELPLELPPALELGGGGFALRARLPVRVDAIGKPTGVEKTSATWGEYAGNSGRTLWVLSRGSRGEGFVTERVNPRDVSYWGVPS